MSVPQYKKGDLVSVRAMARWDVSTCASKFEDDVDKIWVIGQIVSRKKAPGSGVKGYEVKFEDENVFIPAVKAKGQSGNSFWRMANPGASKKIILHRKPICSRKREVAQGHGKANEGTRRCARPAGEGHPTKALHGLKSQAHG